MKDKLSIRGRAARHVVNVANHLPLYKGNAIELRMHLSEREKLWQCPEHLELVHIAMEHFNMELLRCQRTRVAEDMPGGQAAPAGRQDNADERTMVSGQGIILQLHGGGYYGRLKNTYRNMAGLYLELSKGFDVLSIDYRVAPENPYPAALEDAVEAYRWILEQRYDTSKIFVVGDSAGGGLALALTMYLRDHGMTLPQGIITMSAWTDLTKSGESYQENFDIDPVFGRSEDSLVFQDGYYQENDPKEPYISPVMGDYHGFPPMLMQVGEYEMLLSDTLTVTQKARQAGVHVKEHTYPGMFHVFQMGMLLYPESREAWQEAGVFIRRLSRGSIKK